MSDCNCKCCHDHGAILKAHAGVEDVVRDTAEEAMRHAGTMPAVQTTRHSDEYIDEALRQIEEKAKDVSDLLVATAITIPAAGPACDIIWGGLFFIRRRAHEALQPVTITDPPDNGIFTSPGEMAGAPTLNDQTEHHTRHAGL